MQRPVPVDASYLTRRGPADRHPGRLTSTVRLQNASGRSYRGACSFILQRCRSAVPVLSIAKIISRRDPLSQIRVGYHSIRSIRQAARMPGLIEAIGSPSGGGVAFAVSLWEDEASLKAYVHSGAHGNAARAVMGVARAHVTGHVDWDGGTIPPWTEWGAILREAGPTIINTKHSGALTEEEKLAGPRKKARFPLRARGPGSRHRA